MIMRYINPLTYTTVLRPWAWCYPAPSIKNWRIVGAKFF